MYTHIAQLMTHTSNVYIAAAAYLAIMPFGVLQRVLKSQEWCSLGHSKSRYLFSNKSLWFNIQT